jgi:hypothetical protein
MKGIPRWSAACVQGLDFAREINIPEHKRKRRVRNEDLSSDEKKGARFVNSRCLLGSSAVLFSREGRLQSRNVVVWGRRVGQQLTSEWKNIFSLRKRGFRGSLKTWSLCRDISKWIELNSAGNTYGIIIILLDSLIARLRNPTAVATTASTPCSPVASSALPRSSRTCASCPGPCPPYHVSTPETSPGASAPGSWWDLHPVFCRLLPAPRPIYPS